MFLRGLQNFQVFTDHSPLVPILNNHRLDEIDNPRLKRLRARLMPYNFTAVWCKGSTNAAPDALSRYPIKEPTQDDAIAECEEDHTPAVSISEMRVRQSGSTEESVRLQDLRQQTRQDEEYQQLKSIIMQGFPNHRGDLPESCKHYWQLRHHLTVDDDLIVYGCRLLIPSQMRRESSTNCMNHTKVRCAPSNAHGSQFTGQTWIMT